MAQYKKIDNISVERRTTLPIVNNDKWHREMTIAEVFNFNSRQVTTITENICVNKSGGRPSVSSTSHIQNFRDIEGTDGIRRAHEELIKLGGTPAPLDHILSHTGKPRVVGS